MPFAGPLGSSSRRRRGRSVSFSTPAAMENAPAGTPAKAQQVRDLFTFRSNPMTKAQVVAALPEVSLSTVENALHALVREGYLEKIGAGRSTAYLRK